MAKLDGNDALEGLLQDVVSNTEGMEAIKSEIGSDGDDDGEEEGE
jgi:predicted component of type VI protein secretion system